MTRRSASALPLPTKRVLSPAEAAEYLGYSEATNAFYARVKTLGVVPLWKGAFDRETLDRALDRASGLAADPTYGDVDYA